MINEVKNPWENMHLSSTRRTDFNTQFNIFWVIDLHGSFGLLVKFNEGVVSSDFIYNIKGIFIRKIGSNDIVTDVYLFLKDNKDWEIFLSLCIDLLNVSRKCKSESELITLLKYRLKRWQKFLSQDNSLLMNEQKQMGLFAELLCLKDYIIPNFQSGSAVVSWTGPDFDKQDFSLENLFIEVKSFVSSKGAIVAISSLHQLINTIKPLFLFCVGLRRDERGLTIEDLNVSICLLLEKTGGDAKEIYESKLAQYGHMPGLSETNLYRFACDQISIYSVTADFPKITPNDVPSQIISAEYRIDLSRCEKFRTDLNYFLRKND